MESKQKILLAEPNDLLRQVVSDRLKQESAFAVTTVKDGNELEQKLSTDDFHLVIAEELLPFKNGFEIIKSASDRGLPVIIISDADLEEKVLEAFDLGAADFIDKPFSPNEVVARAKNVLRKSNV